MIDFSNKKILVLGDIILDEYIEGEVSRISPEAPIPILDKHKQYYRLGGAANVARNIASLGAKVWLIGRIGNDSAGKRVIKLLTKDNIYVDLLLKDSKIPTILKTRYVANNQQLLRVDYEDRTSVIQNKKFQKLLNQDLDRHMRYFDGMIISDYNKGVVYPKLLQHISCIQKKYQKILTADTHKIDWTPFKGFTCLTPNLKEFQTACNVFVNGLHLLSRYGKQYLKKYRLKQLLITLGQNGMLLVSEKRTKYLASQKRSIIDVTGAGDTVIATYTLGLAAGLPPLKAAILANRAAGIVVTKPGTATVTTEELWSKKKI